VTLQAWGRLGVVALIAVVVQVGVLNGIVVAGAHPDLFLLLAISAGLAAGPQRGAVMAFALGLVADLLVQTPYGLSSLCYVLVAFAVGLAAGTTSGRPPLGFRLATALLGGVGGTLLYAGLGNLIGQPSIPRHQIAVIVLVVTAGCVVLAAPAYRMLEWTVEVAPGAHRDPAAFAGGSAR
jgi:rod shape-determining protein MreD